MSRFVQLEILGGTRPIEGMRFSLNDSRIAEVDGAGLIVARRLGHASIECAIFDGDARLLTADTVYLGWIAVVNRHLIQTKRYCALKHRCLVGVELFEHMLRGGSAQVCTHLLRLLAEHFALGIVT